MATGRRLQRVVDDLDADQATEAMALLESELAEEPEPEALPEFFGMLQSGKGDLAVRSDEILQAEFSDR
jgi:hypothetical protein